MSVSPQPAPPSHSRWLPGSRRRDDGKDHVLDLGRLLLGLVVVTVGILFLLDSAGVLDAGRAVNRWWPLLIIAAGVFTLAERPPSMLRGSLLAGIGAVLLLFTTDVLEENAWGYVWPAILILVGLAIVVRWRGRLIPRGAAGEDVIRSTAIFSGSKLVSTAQQFHGAWLTAIFGGATLDLRGAQLAPDGASVNATVAFGGIEILAPVGWRISMRSTPIFGGVEDKRDHSQPPAADAPTLHIDAVTVFGGVEVKHHP
jgi:predicted membrane protein